MLLSIIFLVSGIISILFVYKVPPFNMPEFDVLNTLRNNHPLAIKICSAILIGYAFLNIIWPI